MHGTRSRIGLGVAALTTFAALAFFVLYLVRWEWHRALVAGVILILAEVAVGIGAILRRLGTTADDDEILSSISAEGRREIDLRWLDQPTDRYGVFVPILLGGGVLISGVAWVVERLAKGTNSGTSSLPGLYRDIALPRDPLLPRDDEVRVRGLPQADDEDLRRLLGPGGRLP